ncbi:hypothetical protein GZL_p00075 (plasmid) [Streptomyces sp. 769]|nr:hypothetical protein GZL_p00075 [Streptomyces sp. 769]
MASLTDQLGGGASEPAVGGLAVQAVLFGDGKFAPKGQAERRRYVLFTARGEWVCRPGPIRTATFLQDERNGCMR